MKIHALLLTLLLLAACSENNFDLSHSNAPENWTAYQADLMKEADISDLHQWWQKFEDPALNKLITIAMQDSPDRRIAAARIAEARGIRRTTATTLFPNIGASASQGREKGQFGLDDFYDARFDASYEIDLFGRNRKATKAADKNINRLQADYHNTSLTLIAEIARDYIDYRTYKQQADIASKNLALQEKTLELIQKQKEFGESPQLDVERAENIVNVTRASIPEYERLADGARFRLSVLVGQIPEFITPLLKEDSTLPDASVQPVMMAPSKILTLRPDVQAAMAYLESTTALKEAAIADIFPTLSFSGFYGVTESAVASSTNIWSVAINAAVNLIDFGRIRGQIESAKAVEVQAFETYRKTLLAAVSEVETALTDYARHQEKRVHLQKAYYNAEKAFDLSSVLYKEGEIGFLDVLEAHRTLNEADSALVTAQAAQTQSLVRLYKSLGVY